ncbi:MAG: MFS transporter [Gemmatimonadota bacterium]|nr:MAG: MFS transporter [Gemmatimonadota bacterium]
MTIPRSKSVLDRFLNLFTEVRSGEGISAVLLCFNIFLILTAYYSIKPVREALILAGGGAELKSYMSAAQAILLLGFVPLYSMLASRFPRRSLINIVTFFFAGCLGLFYILAQVRIPLGVIFFIWVGIFSLMVTAQFWAFANDLYTPEAGKRIFVIVAFGASAGAVFGGFVAGRLIVPLGVYQLMLVSGVLLLLSLIFTNVVDSRQKKVIIEAKRDDQIVEEPLKKARAFKLVFQNKYLLLIAFLILFINWVNTTGEYILGRTVSEAATRAISSGEVGGLTEAEYIGKFYADFFTVVNLIGLLMQLFIVSRVLKYLGIRIAILFLPLIALGGYFIIAFLPMLSIVRIAKTAENSTDYSLQNTVRHALFLPTTREEKYKAKQAVDTFFWRAGDVLSAAVVAIGTNILAFHTKQFALVNIFLVLIWLGLGLMIGKENKRLTVKYNESGP